MKNKITKLFLVLLTFSVNGLTAQEQPMSEKVRQATNIEFLEQFAEEKTKEYEENYEKAVAVATERGMPISGEEEGRFFHLRGINTETNELIYLTTHNNVANGGSIQTANARPLHNAGVIGSGMKVGVWDGGAGLTNHQAFLGGRYVIKDDGNASWTSATGRMHAAHVAGTVAADAIGSDTSVRGLAYGATIYAYNWANDYAEMALAAANSTNPIHVSNHSYGIDYSKHNGGVGIFGRYDDNARSYDLVANNAPYLTIVTSAGNDRAKNYNPGRGGKDLLTWGAVAKNTVTVAAVNGVQNYSSPSSVVMSSFSNWGPTDDFRIKPDISAKGVNVKSITNVDPTSTAILDGTSMASPAVSGVFALWQDHHKSLFEDYMLSSTVRALMAHTAREAGPAPGPDFMFGWGLIDAGEGMNILNQADANTALLKEFELPQTKIFEYEFSYDGNQPLKVTMAWNDPAYVATQWTNVNGKTLVNDLDIRLINVATGKTFFPWSLVHNMSIPYTSNQMATRLVDNMRDNIEKIEPAASEAPAGDYKIVVTHKGNNLSGGKQIYSLIVSGAGGQMPATDGSASLEDIAMKTLKIFPNPVTEVLSIEGELDNLQGADITVFDIAGKKVMNTKVSNNFDSLNVSNLKEGVYILTISKGEAKQDFKFIKK